MTHPSIGILYLGAVLDCPKGRPMSWGICRGTLVFSRRNSSQFQMLTIFLPLIVPKRCANNTRICARSRSISSSRADNAVVCVARSCTMSAFSVIKSYGRTAFVRIAMPHNLISLIDPVQHFSINRSNDLINGTLCDVSVVQARMRAPMPQIKAIQQRVQFLPIQHNGRPVTA